MSLPTRHLGSQAEPRPRLVGHPSLGLSRNYASVSLTVENDRPARVLGPSVAEKTAGAPAPPVRGRRRVADSAGGAVLGREGAGRGRLL